MYIVLKYLRTLFCCFLLCFIFFGVLPGSALAVNENVFSASAPASISLYNSSNSLVTYNFRAQSSVVPSSVRSSISAMLGNNYFIEFTPSGSWSVNGSYGSLGSVFSVNYKASKSGLDLQDLTFEWSPNPYFALERFYNTGSIGFDYTRAFYRVSGSATVTFSDGTSSTIPISVSNGPVSFSAKKDNRTNMFDLTSDNSFTLTSKDTASLVGSLSHSGGTIDGPVSGQVSGTAQLPEELKVDIHAGGTASFSTRGYTGLIRTQQLPNSASGYNTDNTIDINSTGNFKLYAQALALSIINGTFDVRDASIYFGASQAIALSASLVNAKVDSLTVTQAKASAVGTLTAPNSSVDSVVEISRHEPFVTVTGFSVDLTISFPVQSFEHFLDFSNLPFVVPDNKLDISSSSWGGAFYYLDNLSFVWGSSESMLSHIASILDSIYYTLRFDLPLQLRHLIIPTQEEVDDVISDAVKDIEDNAGGLGESIKVVNQEVNEIKNAITSKDKPPIIFPAFDIEIFGRQVKLWDNIDFTPYLQNDLVRMILTPAELMLEFILASTLINHFYIMWVCLTSGCSYFAFIRNVKNEV